MASYCSVLFLGLFLPAVVGLYWLAPQKHRWKVLLIASYAFFWSISGKLLVYLVLSTFSIHHFGLWMMTVQEEKKQALSEAEKSEKKAIKARFQLRLRNIVLLAVLLHIGTLVTLKYTPFFGSNLNQLLLLLNAPFRVPVPRFIMPIGISFYTLQAVSYLLDVYRGSEQADRNLGRLALFMAFFPQIIEGPICRYGQTAHQLWAGHPITYHNLTMGIQRILYGVMKKVVVADRLNLFIKNIFIDFANYDGATVAVAMVFYTCQLYMEFSGTMDMVVGVAEIFGVTMPENFRRPFFSKSISDFWSRWHVSLGTWFRDYVFYPLTMSKPLKKVTVAARKHLGNHFGPLIAGSVALFTVWICNGLWHGAGWQYIFFGLYHFALILTGNIVEPFAQRGAERLHIDRTGRVYHILQIARTVVLVNIGELFFRADGLRAGLTMFRIMVTRFSLTTFTDGSLLELGMDLGDFLIVAVTVVIVFAVSLVNEKGISLRDKVASLPLPARWVLYYALIFFIIIFGAYGADYVPVDPMYANF